jgi:hypothetical protein
LLLAIFMMLSTTEALSQDRAKNNRQQVRTTRAKSVKKSTKASTKDIAGRRLRTKNTSSAGRAVFSISSSNTYKRKSPGTRERAWQGGRDGQPQRVRSTTAQQSRNNIFPQKGRFVNASTKAPPRPYNNRSQLARASRMQRGPISYPPGRKRINNQSASRAYVVRGRKNVYWGKYSKGERAITSDLAGAPLRRRNFRSPEMGFIPQPDTYRGRKRTGDRAYRGSYPSGYASRSRSGRAWKGDVAGLPIRKPGSGKSVELAGERSLRKRIRSEARASADPVPVKAPGPATQEIGRFFSGSFKGVRPKKKSGPAANQQSARVRVKKSAKVNTTPVPVKTPGPQTQEIQRFFGGPFKGVKPKTKSGGRAAQASRKRSARLSGKVSAPVPVKQPGPQTREIGRFFGRPFKGVSPDQARNFGNQGLSYSGNIRVPRGGKAKEYGGQGLNYSGNLKARRNPKGGGSVARNNWNNQGQPVVGKLPSANTLRMGGYSGAIRSSGKARVFSDQGLGYSGNIRVPRGTKGKVYGDQGLSYTGNIRVPRGTRGKEYGNQGLSYSGSIKARRQPKGGGSLARNDWNNQGQPVAGRVPSANTLRMGRYSGTIRSRGKAREFSNQGYDYSGNIKRGPKTFSAEWAGYTGNIRGGKKTFSAEWAGYRGDIRRGKKTFSAEWAGYQGDIRRGKKTFSAEWAGYRGDIRQRGKKVLSREGFDFAGDLKTKRPEKGGGSLPRNNWNNNETAIAGNPPTPEEVRALTYSGNLRQRSRKTYIQNPNAARESLKKKKPTEQDFKVDGLQIPVKPKEYARNDLSAKEALLNIKPGAGYSKVGGIPASTRFRKSYEHNKRSAREALDGTGPSKSSVKASAYARGMKQYWDTRHNPSSAKAALDVRTGGRSFREATGFSGKARLRSNYRHNPNSDRDALKVLAPAKAYARIGDYQGNVKMKKQFERDAHPDGRYANSRNDNVKSERTLMMNVKLMFSKMFKRNANQPNVVKEPVRKPKYDKRERELWKDLYH